MTVWAQGRGFCVFSARPVDESLKSCVVDEFVACEAGLSGGVRTVECFFAVRTGFSQRNPVSSDRIDTGRRDWHRLEDGNRGFWAMRCRQAVPMLPGCANAAKWWQCLRDLGLRHVAVAGFGPGVCVRGRGSPWRCGRPPPGLTLRLALAPQPPRNMDTFCRPAAPAQQWQHDKSETRSNPR